MLLGIPLITLLRQPLPVLPLAPNASIVGTGTMALVNVPSQTMDSLAVNPSLTKSGRLWLWVSNYALGSMGPMVAELPLHVITSISAPAAAWTRIMHNPALRNEFFLIVTPLKWDKWHKLLEEADGLTLVQVAPPASSAM
ncbi:hypothetical protein PILCRDRAFT_14907 [Piloderma croceum F 1598]|uniref:Uncharacterized protein n=1 Tax=Piloderma croceum (strain F 1598) TaxID=765440 RepID=A0A0C3B932_PILCF|nr:hypothetical protein PILCRDRAFT_14907 [Piloderma croceum F 1598]